MTSIIKNEFVKYKKINVFIITNILIIASVGLMYYSLSKLGIASILKANEIMSMFLESTIKLMPYLIVILTSKIITDEFANGGMKISLINPITRNELLLGKVLFILINIILTMLIQIIASVVFSFIVEQAPSMNLLFDITYKYLVTIIPSIGLIAILLVPGLLIKTSRNSTSFGFFIIITLPIVTTIYNKVSPYSILTIINNIGDSSEKLSMNIGVSIVYAIIGFVASSYIFSNKDIR